MNHAPLNYLTQAGAQAHDVLGLTWGVIFISVAVTLIVAVLLVVGIVKRWRVADRDVDPAALAPARPSTGLSWIYVGVGISTVVLLFTAVWTIYTLAAVAYPPSKPAFTVEIIAHQWWWEARYLGNPPSDIFDTANEFHIPVGKPVRFLLKSDDVIHSFWVPQLAGKTDAIPGQLNHTWIEADKPGVYRGQCTEYCGLEHAKMGFRIIADPPAKFQAWLKDQRQLALAPKQGSQAAAGMRIFDSHCGGCHTVRGTIAGGALGPDLTHLMSRGTIAAATLPNDMGDLAGWIADPQHVKPGTQMPAVPLNGGQLQAVLAYLHSLS